MGALDRPAEWVERAAAGAPGRPALHGSNGTLDYAALWERSRRLADRLTELAPTTGRRNRPPVLAVPASDPEWLVPILHAAPRAGWTVQPYGPADDPKRLDALFRLTDPERVVAPSGTALAAGHRLDPEALRPDGEKAPSSRTVGPSLTTDQVHLIVPTSGTAGRPRAAMLTGTNLAAAAEAARVGLGLGPGDLWLDCLPLSHVGGLAIPYRCAAVGAGVVGHDGFSAERVWQDLQRHPVTHLSLVPAMLHRLLRESAGRPPPSALRVALIGGGPLSEPLARRALAAGWPLCPSYGLTETCGQAATLCGADGHWQPGQVGQPLPGMGITITRPDPAGVGRIRVEGAQVMAGYANPAGRAGEGLEPDGGFETGDLGRWDPERGLTVLGRADAVLVSGGQNVHPEEVEAVLARCPGIEEAAVAGRDDPVWGQRLVAVYTGTWSPAEVERWCRRHLSGARLPRTAVHTTALPRLDNGKLDRRALQGTLGP